MELVLSAASKQNLDTFWRQPNGSFIFSGPEAIGKRTIARFLANKIKIAPGNLIVLEPDGKSIGIEVIHNLQRQLYLKGIGSGFQLAIINNAHTMTRQAQSALLKTLEEPSPSVSIVLVTHLMHQLLPTIISRCKQIAFTSPSDRQITNFIENTYTDATVKPSVLLSLAGGKIGNAVSLLNSPKRLAAIKLRHSKVIEYAKQDLFTKLTQTASLSDEAGEFISILARALKAARRKAITEGRYARARRLNAMCQSCATLLEYLEHNGNSKLALDRLALEMSQ